jgi:hypothetical protein
MEAYILKYSSILFTIDNSIIIIDYFFPCGGLSPQCNTQGSVIVYIHFC